MEILVITGMSGSGKSHALNVLEDMGYFAMDNLPPQLIPKFVEMALVSDYVSKVCIGVDIRSGKFFDEFESSMRELKDMNVNYKVLFLEASEDVIINRYKQERRPHPLNNSIVKGYKIEKEILKDIKASSDYILDTSNFSNKELKENLEKLLSVDSKKLVITLTSFGFKNGILLDGDLIFDVRFLPNPYYINELKMLNGNHCQTKDYVLKHEVTQQFIEKTVDLINFLIPNYEKEGKSVLSIGFGCTGGFHRSVAITNEISRRLSSLGRNISVVHRDVDL